jgi:hypothetical protein
MSGREEVRIGTSAFHIRKYEPFRALKILGDLQKRFIAPFLSVLDGKEAGTEAAVTAGVMAGVERVLRDMDGDQLVAVAIKLLDVDEQGLRRSDYVSVTAPGEETRKLDASAITTLLPDVADLIELCVAVAMTNFRGVFTRAASLFGAAQAPLPTPLSSGSLGASRPN